MCKTGISLLEKKGIEATSKIQSEGGFFNGLPEVRCMLEPRFSGARVNYGYIKTAAVSLSNEHI